MEGFYFEIRRKNCCLMESDFCDNWELVGWSDDSTFEENLLLGVVRLLRNGSSERRSQYGTLSSLV